MQYHANEPYVQLRHSIKMAQRVGYFVQRPLRGVVCCYRYIYVLQQGARFGLHIFLENGCT